MKKILCTVFPSMGMLGIFLILNFIEVNLKGLSILCLVIIFPLLFLVQGFETFRTKNNVVLTFLSSTIGYLITISLFLNSSAIGYIVYYLVFYLIGYKVSKKIF